MEIDFVSVPQHAEVFHAGSDEPLGLTPFSFKARRSDDMETFEFRLASHRTARQEISMSESSRVVATLSKVVEPKLVPLKAALKKRKPKKRKPKKKKQRKAEVKKEPSSLDRRGIIDPFDE